MSHSIHFNQIDPINLFDVYEPLYTESDIERKSPQEMQIQEIQIGSLHEKIVQLKVILEDKQYFAAKQLMDQIYNSYHKHEIEPYQDVLRNLQEDYDEIKQLIRWFELEDGWSLQTKDSHMKVRYQQLPNSSRVVARIDTEVRIPLDVFVSLIYETELYPKWFPFCKSSTTLKQPDKATKILRIQSSPPIINDRELCVKGWGVNNLDYDGSIYILSHSIDQMDHQLQRYEVTFPILQKIVRSDLHVFCTKIVPITHDHHIVSLVICIDLKLKYIPDFLPNYMLRRFSGVLFDKLMSNAKNYKGSIWEERKNNDTIFYEWINEKYESFKEHLKRR